MSRGKSRPSVIATDFEGDETARLCCELADAEREIAEANVRAELAAATHLRTQERLRHAAAMREIAKWQLTLHTRKQVFAPTAVN